MSERSRLRVLMLGTVNSPLVTRIAVAMRERGFDVVVAGDARPGLRSQLDEAGIPVRLAPDSIRTPLFGLLPHVHWIRRLLGELRPDLVHAHHLWTFGFPAAAAGASPLLVKAWGSDVLVPSGRGRVLRRLTLRRADLVTAPTPHMRRVLLGIGADPDRTVVLGWGVDLERFSPGTPDRGALRRQLGLGHGPVVLSPRALRPLYNPDTIVAAFDAVADRIPDARLVMLDAAADRPALASARHGDRVHRIEQVSYERMPDLYRAADVCVSIPSSDGSPNSVWEAMACGCPCVLSELPWLEGMVEPGEDALVVPIEAQAVAGAIARVLEGAEPAAALRRRGRALVERTQDERVVMDRYAELYERVARPEKLRSPGPSTS